MDLLKNIKVKKTDRNILIHDSNIDTRKINQIKDRLKLYNFTNVMLYSRHIYNVYYVGVYNPPFFNNIICVKNIISEEDIKELWNMVVVNGNIFIYEISKKELNKYRKNTSIFNNSILDKSSVLIKKYNNHTYQFPQYRIIDFIIAGTMKGGTTAGITNFSKHPEISMFKEEIHYFDVMENYQKGTNWYKSHFDYSKKMVGDKAPDVMYQDICLELLQIANPYVKILLFLRNPIERAYSHWKMLRDSFKVKRSFKYSVMDEINNRWGENRSFKISFWRHILQRGLYFEQIKRILKYFSIDNIHISISENIRHDMDSEYQKIFKFLGVSEFHFPFEEDFVSKSNDKLDKNSEIYKMLQKLFDKDKKSLEKFLGYKTGWW